jgi:hypothetical protein
MNKEELREYKRQWERSNRDRRREINLRWRRQEREKISEIKRVPCMDCGLNWPPYVMHFDHLYDKEFDIADKVGRWSWTRILQEISKCDIVCGNCHAIRTYNRRAALV